MNVPILMKRMLVALAAVTLTTAVFGILEHFDPLGEGLRAEYFANSTWSPPEVLSRIEPDVSTRGVLEAFHGAPPGAFSIAWSGWIVAPRAGDYTFETISDDGSTVVVDGERVVSNGSRYRARPASGSIQLAAGPHRLVVEYFQNGGGYEMALLWSRNGAALVPVHSWLLRTRRGSTTARTGASVLLSVALAASEWLWVSMIVATIIAGCAPAVRRLRGRLERRGVWPAIGWVLAASAALNVIGLWWGLPARWVSIEVNPEFVLDALAHHFSNGWFKAYPPVHYYVLSLAYSPAFLLERLGRIAFDSISGYVLLMVIGRLVSVLAAAGILIAICLCTAALFGPRASLFSAAMIALMAPFLYYAKTANVDVPYLFWFSLSMIFYARMLDVVRLGDVVAFAAAGMLSICTKDQAYGLYLFAPVAVIYRIWRTNRDAGVDSVWRVLVDRRLLGGAATAVLLFALCYNLPLNLTGLVAHVRFIVGPGSVGYRQFEPTASGRWALLTATIQLIEESMGWPFFVAALAGVCIAAAAPRHRLVLVWMSLPVLSYYFGFIDVVLYNYDRFVLPICFILAMFGGLAIDRLLGASASRWTAATVAAAFAYTLLYAGTVDVLMVGDSRYVVQRWLADRVGSEQTVGSTGPRDSLPRLDDFAWSEVSTVADLAQRRPTYFVLNADYARSAAEDSAWGQLIAGLERGTLGYRLVFRYRRPSPWRWLPLAHPDLVGPRTEAVVFSTLHSINPTIEIFQRDSIGGPTGRLPLPADRRSGREAISQDGSQRRESIMPADLLAGGFRAGVDLHRQFDNPMASQQELGRNLRFDIEPVRFEVERARHLQRHHLVAGLHVGNPAAAHDIGERCQRAVRDACHQRHLRTAPEEAGPVDDLGFAPDDRFDERGQLQWIELEVRILDGEDGAARSLDARPDRGALAPIALACDHRHPGTAFERAQHLRGPVGGAVVHHDDFMDNTEIDRQEPLDDREDRRGFVEDGHDDRERCSGGRQRGFWYALTAGGGSRSPSKRHV